MRRITTGDRLAIRVDGDTLLAVPPMKYRLPSTVRVKVFEYVLRRQLGLAQALIDIENDLIEGRERGMSTLLSVRPLTEPTGDDGMARAA